MFEIEIISCGGEKESSYKEAAAEYIKRIKPHFSFSEKMIKDEKLPDAPSEKEIAAALEKEGERLLAASEPKRYKIAMCIEGKQLSSEELAELFASLAIRGYSGASFFVGSSMGLSKKVKGSADLKLSMSKMTFPHRLARVMLLEQIYRAGMINAGAKYHK